MFLAILEINISLEIWYFSIWAKNVEKTTITTVRVISFPLVTRVHTTRVEALLWMRCWVVSCVFSCTGYVFAWTLNQKRLMFSFLLYPESLRYDLRRDARGCPVDHWSYSARTWSSNKSSEMKLAGKPLKIREGCTVKLQLWSSRRPRVSLFYTRNEDKFL